MARVLVWVSVGGLLLGGLSACGEDGDPNSPTPETSVVEVDTPPCEEVEDTPYLRTRSRNTGELVWWPMESIEGCLALGYSVSEATSLAPSRVAEIFADSIAVWTAPLETCAPDVCVRVTGDVPTLTGVGYDPEGPNANILLMTSREARWTRSSAVIATTVLSIEPEDSRIVDADIFVNDVHYNFSDTAPPLEDAFDLQSVLLHELGHLLTIDHNDNQNSVMFPTETQGVDFKRTLDPIDSAALCEAFSCYTRDQ